MFEDQASRVQKQATETEAFAKRPVLLGVAVARIADYGTIDMGHMASQLMASTSRGREFHAGIASLFEGAARKR